LTIKIISILFFLFLCACSDNPEHGLIGTWKAGNYTLWEKGVAFLTGVRGFESQHELILKSDSSYREQTCGNFYVGKWTLQNDSLILKCDTTWYRRHYHTSAGIASKLQTIFTVKKNKLVKIYKGKRYSVQNNDSEKLLNGYSMTILK
jgi:hypothetical protein